MPELPDIEDYRAALEPRGVGAMVQDVRITGVTGGRILADRSLSRLLKDDWPRTIDQLEGS
ncbi:MAG: hypothetical protein R6U94_10230 [Nitriliruptoraceae bacterium]